LDGNEGTQDFDAMKMVGDRIPPTGTSGERYQAAELRRLHSY
jgi:hypothetical protein